MMQEYLPVIRRVPLFCGIAEEDLLPMLRCLSGAARRFPKGGAVLRAGDEAAYVGVVLSGGVQVTRDEADGSRLVLAAIGSGGLFAEAFACARVESLPVTVTASEDSHILLLDREKILTPCSHLCRFHTRLIANLMEVLAQKNILLSRKLEHVSKRTLREKLLSYLWEQAHQAQSRSFSIPFDRQALADYLCADRSALSRELGKLRAEGILRAERSRFTLLRDHEEADR